MTAGLRGGIGGVVTSFLRSDSGTSGFVSGASAAPPGLGPVAGDVVPCGNLKLGLVTVGVWPAPPGGTGGPPCDPGTGKAFLGKAFLGKASGVTLAGNGLPGVAPAPAGMPGLMAVLIEALGGTGSFPC